MDGSPEPESVGHALAASRSGGMQHPHDANGHHGEYHDPRHDDSGIDLMHVGYLLLRRSWIILLVVLAGGIPVTAWVLRKPPLYQSTGIIMVEPKEENPRN